LTAELFAAMFPGSSAWCHSACELGFAEVRFAHQVPGGQAKNERVTKNKENKNVG